MKPLLSICVLTYNRPNFLADLLNSVFALDRNYLDQVEIIVIDNGSTDETWKTIQKYATSTNFVSERFSVNLRGSASYLELIKRAKGDFLVFPGDDDVFKTKTLAEAIKFLGEFGENYSHLFRNTECCRILPHRQHVRPIRRTGPIRPTVYIWYILRLPLAVGKY